jgi:hypothetical protein
MARHVVARGTFSDVLLSAPRRLHHLIVRARPPVHEPLAERHGGVVD